MPLLSGSSSASPWIISTEKKGNDLSPALNTIPIFLEGEMVSTSANCSFTTETTGRALEAGTNRLIEESKTRKNGLPSL